MIDVNRGVTYDETYTGIYETAPNVCGNTGLYTSDPNGELFGFWDITNHTPLTEPYFYPVPPDDFGYFLIYDMRSEEVLLLDENLQCVSNLTEKWPELSEVRLSENRMTGDVDGSGKITILDALGNLISHTDYDNIGWFSGGVAFCVKDGLYGYVDSNGNEVVPPKYIYASNTQNGVGFLENDNGIYLFTMT